MKQTLIIVLIMDAETMLYVWMDSTSTPAAVGQGMVELSVRMFSIHVLLNLVKIVAVVHMCLCVHVLKSLLDVDGMMRSVKGGNVLQG